MYRVGIFITSVILVGMCIYEMVAVFSNASSFDDPDKKSSCYQNRILLVGQCIIGYLILIKDIVTLCYDQTKESQKANPLD